MKKGKRYKKRQSLIENRFKNAKKIGIYIKKTEKEEEESNRGDEN